MNGTWASGLVIGLGWWALGGIVEEKPDVASKSYVWSLDTPSNSPPARRAAVTLGRPLPVSLEKPRPLAQEVASGEPNALNLTCFNKRAARKPIFRAQSLEESPPSVPDAKAEPVEQTTKEAEPAINSNDKILVEETISPSPQPVHPRPIRLRRKVSNIKPVSLPTGEESSAKSASPPENTNSTHLAKKVEIREAFAQDRTEGLQENKESVPASTEGTVQFASDREPDEPTSIQEPAKEAHDRGRFASGRALAQRPKVINAFHQLTEHDEEIDTDIAGPKRTGKPGGDEAIDKSTSKDEPTVEDKIPANPPGPLDQTNIKLCEPRIVPNASVEFVEPNRFYGAADYLVWFTKGDRIPPLITTGPIASSGILGRPGTVILFGNQQINNEWHSGGRFTLGYWLDPCQELGIEGSYFFLNQRTTRFFASSDAFPLLARPIFEQNNGQEFSEISTRPDLATGSVSVDSPSRLWGAELNWREKFCCGCNYRVDVLAGFRYAELDEGLHVTENLLALPTAPRFAGDRIIVTDRFDTRNQFYGGQIGVDTEYRSGNWFVDGKAKVALGDNHETLNIVGNQLITTPAGNATLFTGGLLALPSNIGHFTRDRFAVVPEIGMKVGYQFGECLRFTVGYDLFYWSRVIRPGGQVDRVVDINQIPNFGVIAPPVAGSRPAVLFKGTDFWAQGISFGVEFRY